MDVRGARLYDFSISTFLAPFDFNCPDADDQLSAVYVSCFKGIAYREFLRFEIGHRRSTHVSQWLPVDDERQPLQMECSDS